MLRNVIIAVLVALTGCSGMKPITVAQPSWSGLMGGQTIYQRLEAAKVEIDKAPRSKKKEKKVAWKAFFNTELAWESYSNDPTVETWMQVQAIGSALDDALRKLRGEKTGAPGQMPPCVTMRESWCKKPSIGKI